MKNCHPTPNLSALNRAAVSCVSLLCLFVLLLANPAARAAELGTITGSVSNSATRNTLEGAVVAVPALSVSTLTDNSGRYTLSNLPAGMHEIVVTYIGLDAVHQKVAVSAGESLTRDFDLTTGVYKLDSFKVTGEREGNAAMITEKKNADNVKDVIAMDAFGYLPNMSAGEVVMRLPGVAGSPTDEGLNYRFNIRGMDPTLNNVTVDGGSLTTLGTNRSFELQSITGAMFEGMELIKGQTPDKGADSLGGTINFKTRGALSMKEKRLFTYNVGGTWAPTFTAHTPARRDRPVQPLVSGTYNEVFSILGGERNLGIAVNGFYQDKVVSYGQSFTAYENTTASPAYAYDYRISDAIHESYQKDLNVRTDFRLSSASRFSLNLKSTDHLQPTFEQAQVRAFTALTPPAR